MNFSIYGGKVTINDEMRKHIEDKLSFLSKYLVVDDNTSARVTVKTYDDTNLKIEITIPSKVGLLRSEVIHKDFMDGVDLAADKLEDQIRRNKSRLSRKHKDSLALSFVEEAPHETVTFKTKTVYLDEMDVEEAIMEMENLSHSFFVFKNIDTKDTNLVYKRNDGRYGLLVTKS